MCVCVVCVRLSVCVCACVWCDAAVEGAPAKTEQAEGSKRQKQGQKKKSPVRTGLEQQRLAACEDTDAKGCCGRDCTRRRAVVCFWGTTKFVLPRSSRCFRIAEWLRGTCGTALTSRYEPVHPTEAVADLVEYGKERGKAWMDGWNHGRMDGEDVQARKGK